VRTHYDVLGIAPAATHEEVKRAYHRRAREHHPDVRAGAGGPAMTEINAAWAVLGDPDRRRAYDREISRAADAGESGRDPRATSGGDDSADLADLLTPDPEPPPPRPADALVLVPVVLLASAAGCLGFATMTESQLLLLGAAILFALAVTAFLAAPLVVLRRAVRRRASDS